MGVGCLRGIGESPYMGATGTASQPVPGRRWRQRPAYVCSGMACWLRERGDGAGRLDGRREACIAQWPAGVC